jgi:hypothetical protein
MYPLWIRVGTLNDNFVYDCKYNYINNYETPLELQQIFKNYISEPRVATWYKPWFSMKIAFEDETYILSRINNSVETITEKSQIRFLSIEYTHPDMDIRIPFEIDPQIYMLGNELFSVSMVKHLLEHQSEKYVFDMKYTIFLMDNHINMYELKYNEYIFLDKKNINIMSF